MMPALQARDALAAGALRPLHEEVAVPVALYWHQWQLQAQPSSTTAVAAPSHRLALLDQVGMALAAGARRALASDIGVEGEAKAPRRRAQRELRSPR